MVLNYFEKLIKQLGSTKFSILYSVVFSVLINGISMGVIAILGDEPWASSRVVSYLISYFVIGFFIARQIIKKVKS